LVDKLARRILNLALAKSEGCSTNDLDFAADYPSRGKSYARDRKMRRGVAEMCSTISSDPALGPCLIILMSLEQFIPVCPDLLETIPSPVVNHEALDRHI
jgi:hypothetical protein